MRCRWCWSPIPRKRAALALIGRAPMACEDLNSCRANQLAHADPPDLEAIDWENQPPADIYECTCLDGAVIDHIDWETGAPVPIECPICKGAGNLRPRQETESVGHEG